MGTTAIRDTASNLVAFSANYFEKASPFNATVIPGAGHGLNLGYSHTRTFSTMLEFLEAHV